LPEKRPIQILFLTNSLHPGGAEKFLLHHLRSLDRTQYEPVVCQMKSGGELQKSFLDLGIEVISLKQHYKLQPKALWRLWRLLRDRRIDILQTHVYYSCITGRIIGRLARVSVLVCTEQDVRLGAQANQFFKRLLNDATMSLSDANIYISEAVARSFESAKNPFLNFGRIRRVIPNGIRFEDFEDVRGGCREEMRKELGIPSQSFVIGHIGRLESQKGQKYLLEAFAQMQNECPDALLVIVGWGTLKPYLEELARRFGVEQKVIFLGQRTDVEVILPVFDLFCYPSIFEGQGIAVLEAMAAGIPVVASDVGGIPEMVRHEDTGLLFKSGSAQGILEMIQRIYQNRAFGRRLADNARSHVTQKYSIGATARAYDQVYRELLTLKNKENSSLIESC
jgi:glycosyltransferase involved in cell wall biosynthesis